MTSTSQSLWNYYRDEINYGANEDDNTNNKINNDKAKQLNILNIRQVIK